MDEQLREQLMEIEDAWGMDHFTKEKKLIKQLVQSLPEEEFDKVAGEFYVIDSTDPVDREVYDLIKEAYANGGKFRRSSRSKKSKDMDADEEIIAMQLGAGHLGYGHMVHSGYKATPKAKRGSKKRTQVGGNKVWISHPLFQQGGYWASEEIVQMGGDGWMPDAASDYVGEELEYDTQMGGRYYY
jgi:hypothetical protein